MATATALASAAKVLRDSPLPLLRSLEVAENDDEVTLRGQVSSYYHKQLAQEAVLPVLGARRLQNLLVVQ